LGCFHENWVDDTAIEFPRIGFWALHAIGAGLIFGLGMRYAVRRAPLPIVGYHLLKMLMHR
jgi:hypothetical protein